jgi:hypothetical protein
MRCGVEGLLRAMRTAATRLLVGGAAPQAISWHSPEMSRKAALERKQAIPGPKLPSLVPRKRANSGRQGPCGSRSMEKATREAGRQSEAPPLASIPVMLAAAHREKRACGGACGRREAAVAAVHVAKAGAGACGRSPQCAPLHARHVWGTFGGKGPWRGMGRRRGSL